MGKVRKLFETNLLFENIGQEVAQSLEKFGVLVEAQDCRIAALERQFGLATTPAPPPSSTPQPPQPPAPKKAKKAKKEKEHKEKTPKPHKLDPKDLALPPKKSVLVPNPLAPSHKHNKAPKRIAHGSTATSDPAGAQVRVQVTRIPTRPHPVPTPPRAVDPVVNSSTTRGPEDGRIKTKAERKEVPEMEVLDLHPSPKAKRARHLSSSSSSSSSTGED